MGDLDKSLLAEISKVTRRFGIKNEQCIANYAKEEKKINEEHRHKLSALEKEHGRELIKLKKRLKSKQKNMQKRIDRDSRADLRLIQRTGQGRRSQSLYQLNTASSLSSSDIYGPEFRLETMTPRSEIGQSELRQHRSVSDLTLAQNASHSTSSNRRRWKPSFWTNKRSRQPSASSLQRETSLEEEDGETDDQWQETTRRLQGKFDDQLAYCRQDSKRALAELEWRFLQEKQDLARINMDRLSELKQNRLMDLGQLKKSQIRLYYEMQRKWMTEHHRRELEHRQLLAQETSKSLHATQQIHRQTAKNLTETSVKGQKSIERVLAKLELTSKSGSLGRKQRKLRGRVNSSHSNGCQRVESTLSVGQDDTAPVDESGGRLQLNNRSLSVDQCSMGTPTESLPDIDHHSISSSSRPPRSILSSTSAVTGSERMRNLIMAELFKQQQEQWSDLLASQREQSDALIRSQADQRKAVLEEELAELKQIQLEQRYKSAQLAVTLEAARKFSQREFELEQKRLTDFYFGPSETRVNESQSRPGSSNATLECLSVGSQCDTANGTIIEDQPPHQASDHRYLTTNPVNCQRADVASQASPVKMKRSHVKVMHRQALVN